MTQQNYTPAQLRQLSEAASRDAYKASDREGDERHRAQSLERQAYVTEVKDMLPELDKVMRDWRLDFSDEKPRWPKDADGETHIADVQERLKAAGFYDGPIDGEFGPGSARALIKAAQFGTREWDNDYPVDLELHAHNSIAIVLNDFAPEAYAGYLASNLRDAIATADVSEAVHACNETLFTSREVMQELMAEMTSDGDPYAVIERECHAALQDVPYSERDATMAKILEAVRPVVNQVREGSQDAYQRGVESTIEEEPETPSVLDRILKGAPELWKDLTDAAEASHPVEPHAGSDQAVPIIKSSP